MAITGSSVELSCVMKDASGDIVNPEVVEVRLYDANREQIGETKAALPDGDGYKLKVEVPGPGNWLYYEFKGEFCGYPIIYRSQIKREWSR